MPLTQKHRPPHLDTTASHSLAIARIVSPVASLLMSEDMRNTFRISQSIRQQQTDLIAAAQERLASEKNGDENEKERNENVKENNENVKENNEKYDEKYEIDENPEEDDANASTHIESGNGISDGNNRSADSTTLASSAASGASHSATSATSQSSPGLRSSAPTNESPDKSSDKSASPSGASSGHTPGPRMLDRENSEFDRMSAALSLKKLKRDRAPTPLRIPGHARGVLPAINSAPIRTYYSGIPSYTGYSIPVGYPGRNHSGHAGVGGPVGNLGGTTPLSLATAGYFQPRRMPIRQFVQPGPYPVQVVQTPLRRNIPSVYERKTARPRGKDRRKPVQDVFLGDVKREAPMTSQPPSAQKEYFDNHEDDRTDATDEEMREMESKRLANALVEGTISFDEQAAFNFKIFGERDHDAKSKFMKMCETTWDQYMTRQT